MRGADARRSPGLDPLRLLIGNIVRTAPAVWALSRSSSVEA